ncbi:TolC family protein [Colwelliaceae bacterium 6441]
MYISSKNTGVVLSLGVLVCFSYSAVAKENSQTWLDAQINKDPEVVKAKALLQATNHQAKSLTQAVYNPDFEASYEKEGDFDNFSIGLSQTIDVWDKQSINKTIGEIDLYGRQQQLLSLLESKKAKAISTLINWYSAKESVHIAIEREKQLQTLLDIVEEKRSAGILGPLDAELVYLNLSQVLNEIAQYQIGLTNAEVKIQELLPDWISEKPYLIPRKLGISTYSINTEWIDKHPDVQVAKAEWHVQQEQAKLSSIEYKANPTVGLSAGQNGEENTLGLTFSMPLNIRNNYSDSIKAAHSEANAAEANFRAIYRKQTFEAKANYESVVTIKKYYQQWQRLISGRVENSAKLLKKRWEAGDMNTSDYMLALNQRSEGLQAGIQLEKQFKLAEIEFLLSIGQISKLRL